MGRSSGGISYNTMLDLHGFVAVDDSDGDDGDDDVVEFSPSSFDSGLDLVSLDEASAPFDSCFEEALVASAPSVFSLSLSAAEISPSGVASASFSPSFSLSLLLLLLLPLVVSEEEEEDELGVRDRSVGEDDVDDVESPFPSCAFRSSLCVSRITIGNVLVNAD